MLTPIDVANATFKTAIEASSRAAIHTDTLDVSVFSTPVEMLNNYPTMAETVEMFGNNLQLETEHR